MTSHPPFSFDPLAAFFPLFSKKYEKNRDNYARRLTQTPKNMYNRRQSTDVSERKFRAMDKTTKELLETMKTSKNYYEYLVENETSLYSGKMKPGRALKSLIAESGMKKADIIAKSTIEQHYAYQIFEDKKRPSRDKMIMLCFGLQLSLDDANDLFKVTGYPPLYAKDMRDNIIIYCLEKKQRVIDVNLLLAERGFQTLD